MEITNAQEALAFAKPYILDKKRNVSRNHGELCDYAHHLKFHSDGYTPPQRDLNGAYGSSDLNPYFLNWNFQNPEMNIWFARLIWKRRPGEDQEIKAYRANNWKPITKVPLDKVFSVLRKIVKSPDFQIDYSKSVIPNSLENGKDDPRVYTEKTFPNYHSVEAYAFNYLLRELVFRDPNALIGIKPINEEATTEFYKPYPFVYGVEAQLHYEPGEIALVRCMDDDEESEGYREYELWTKTAIYSIKHYLKAAKQTERVEIDEILINPFEGLPIWRPLGNVKKHKGHTPENISYIDSMLPHLDTAAGEISDMDAEIVQHLHSTMWYYSGQNCTFCNGAGKVQNGDSLVTCDKCKGEGVMPKSPYKDIVVRPAKTNLGEQAMSAPFAGYVEKSIEMAKLMQTRIDKHFMDAAGAVQMEFLYSVPGNQSGYAKTMDRDAMFDFVYPVGYFMVESCLKPMYYWINQWRYSGLISDEKTLDEMLPHIAVPERFDIVTEAMLIDEIKQLRDGKADPVIIAEKELDYAFKSFGDNLGKFQKIALSKKLDPFPALTTSEKQDALLTDSVKKSDVIKSLYLPSILEELGNTIEGFYNMPILEQTALVDKEVSIIAAEIKTVTDVRTLVRANISSGTGGQ